MLVVRLSTGGQASTPMGPLLYQHTNVPITHAPDPSHPSTPLAGPPVDATQRPTHALNLPTHRTTHELTMYKSTIVQYNSSMAMIPIHLPTNAATRKTHVRPCLRKNRTGEEDSVVKENEKVYRKKTGTKEVELRPTIENNRR